MTQYLDIDFSHTAPNGQRFSVSHNGAQVIKSTKNPEHDGARYLRDAGYAGEMITRVKGKDSLIGDIEQCAKRTISETDRHGPRSVKFVPFDRAPDTQGAER